MSGGTLIGLFALGVGLLLTLKAYEVSRFQERLDAIGSTTPWHEVEPAGWRVTLTRAIGVGILIVGLVVFLSAL